MDFILNNMDQKSGTWFYFDIDYGKWLYLNGLPKQKRPHESKERHKNNDNYDDFAMKRNDTFKFNNSNSST